MNKKVFRDILKKFNLYYIENIDSILDLIMFVYWLREHKPFFTEAFFDQYKASQK